MNTTLGQIINEKHDDNSVEFLCENGRMMITVLGLNVIRIQASLGEKYRNHKSFARVPYQEAVSIKVSVVESGWSISTGQFIIKVTHDARVIMTNEIGGYVIFDQKSAVSWTGSEFRVRFRMTGEEHFYGFGEKAHGLDKRGLHYEMWNTSNPDYDSESDPLYQSIPFFIVLRGGIAHGVFLDNTYRTCFDMGNEEEETYYFGSVDGPVDFYVIYGPTISEVIWGYTAITGKPYFFPRWALGHQHSRWMEYNSQEDILSLAHEFRSRKIPCDTLVLDIAYMDEYRIFTWDSKIFPSPKQFTDRLRREHFRVVAIIDPGVKLDESYKLYKEGTKEGYFLKRSDGSTYIGLVWPGETVFPDFSRKEVRDWFGTQYVDFVKSGVSNSSWLDMNEPENCIYEGLREEYSMKTVVDNEGNLWEPRLRNVYGLGMVQAAFEGLKRAFPRERPFLLTRSGFAGYQRYAAMWTGDNNSTWEHLWLSIPMLLNLGLSGVPFGGADIGGFSGDVTPELLVRWFQLGSFYPFSRNHSRLNTARQEPWLFGKEVEDIVREYLSLRYTLMRYLYSLLYEASSRGTPIMRPLVLEFQDDPNTYTIDDQFLVGPFILIAPVLNPNVDTRQVYLPEGAWIDYWSHRVIQGASIVTIDAPLDKMPIFLRSGAIIPTGRTIQYSDEDQGNLILWVCPYGDGEFVLYEDDGLSENGPYSKTRFTMRGNDNEANLLIHEREGTFPIDRQMVIQFWGISKQPTNIMIDDDIIELTSNSDPLCIVRYEQIKQMLVITLDDDGQPHNIRIMIN